MPFNPHFISPVGDQARGLEETCLFAHNKLRALHQNTQPVTYDSNLAAGAQHWAENLAGQGGLVHDNSGYGENLYYGATSVGAATYTPADAIFAWFVPFNIA